MEAINILRQKIAKATAGMHAIIKDSEADAKTYTYSYASLNSVLRVVKAGLEPHNLVVSQPIGIDDNNNLVVTTVITDIDSGEALSFPGAGTPIKGDPQAAGSTISYFRRYSLVSLFALEAEDDDGAMGHRQAVNPNRRTEAEAEIRDGLDKMSVEDKKLFAEDFKGSMGSTLSNLPESKHGDALHFYKFWIAPSQEEEADNNGSN